MAQRQPTTLLEFSTIVGVGQVKLARYGKQFAELIQAFPRSPILQNRSHPNSGAGRNALAVRCNAPQWRAGAAAMPLSRRMHISHTTPEGTPS